jgi:DNA modification methylase
VFPRHTLEDVVFFRDQILQIKNHNVCDFLLLGLMNVAVKCSYAYKDGAVVKIRKKAVPPLRDMLRRQLFRMAKDMESLRIEKCETFADFGDSRALPLESGSMDAVITSPPYMNKIEYTKVYEIEQQLFLNRIHESPAVRSYIGLSLSKLEQDSSKLEKALDYGTVRSLPQEAIPYLMDMFQAIEEMHRVCRKGAKLGIVVGNGCFPTGVVDSDILLSRMAESIGFKVEKILVLNKRWCTRNRTEKVGITRESLLLWSK